jgi:serine protease Do
MKPEPFTRLPMNSRIRYLLAATLLGCPVFTLSAAEDKAAEKEEKKSMRVLAPREPGRTRIVEKETVAFLGVETAPVSATTAAQLGLARGTGLVVNHVVPKSSADGVLNQHDVLLKLDDQILIETRQLSVLIRTRKEGDEITLSYIRGGQKATAKVKLGKTEVPKLTGVFGLAPAPVAIATSPGHFDYAVPPPIGPDEERAETDRVLSLFRHAPGGEPIRIQIDREHGPGFRAMALHTANSNMVFTDDNGSLELTIKDGAKTLVAKDAAGKQTFSGPVSTPEERKAMPPQVRERLEKLEGMHDITFHTDGEFRGGETRVLRPRGIGFPLNDYVPLRAQARVFY